MTRTMYDAVTVSDVPATATLIAGYGDGYYQNVDAFKARFPHATVVEITVRPADNLGQVLDVENGDATPLQAPAWVAKRRQAGVDPSVYCNSSTWPQVRAEFAAQGVAEPHYWVAQYDGDPTIPQGAVAKQYQDVGPYDLSSVADDWPGIDPQEVDMPLSAADLAAIRGELNAALQDPANRSLEVADGLWWEQHALEGVVPAGASPAAAAAIMAIHNAYAVLAKEPAPAPTAPAK